jgi:hypothetical protein
MRALNERPHGRRVTELGREYCVEQHHMCRFQTFAITTARNPTAMELGAGATLVNLILSTRNHRCITAYDDDA